MPDGADPWTFEIDVPSTWTVDRSDSPCPLVARPIGWVKPRLEPSLNVLDVTTASGRTDETGGYVQEQLDGLARHVGPHRIIDLDTAERDGVLFVDMMFAAESALDDMTVCQRHLVQGTRSLIATGACSDPDWPTLMPVLLPAVQSLRLVPAAEP